MSFKSHLLIVTVIILVVYLAWGVTRAKPKAPEQAAAVSAYTINIAHADWGLNCPVFAESPNSLDKAYVKKAPSSTAGKPQKDNALEIVKSLCNGKEACEFPVNDETFAGLVSQDCGEKKLEVEYRCYAFDRPWYARASAGMLAITCEDKKPQ
jgi:hypothetical protein